MALLNGFPPSNTLSPGVRVTEIDNSLVPVSTTFHRVGLVGFASKGPINVATSVTSTRDLHRTFGFPHPTTGDPYLIYAGENYLSLANELFVVRCADTDAVSDTVATTASINIPSAGGVVDIISNTISPYSFSVDSFFRWRLNGILASKVLVVLAPANRPSPDTGVAYTAATLRDALNAQITPGDGILFYATSGDKIELKSTFSFGLAASIELVSVSDAIYGPILTVNGSGALVSTTPVSGLGTTMTSAKVIGTADRYPNNSYQTAGVYDLTGVTTPFINVVIDGTFSSSIDNIVQKVVLTATSGTILQKVTEINNYIAANLPGGFIAYAVGNNLAITTLHSGADARLLVKSDSTTDVIFGLSNTTAVGTSPSAVTGGGATYAAGLVTGIDNLTSEVTFIAKADSTGIEGNNTQLVIANDIRQGSFSVQVFSSGVLVEAWGQLSKDQTSRYYLESFVALFSEYVRFDDDTSVTALPLAGTYALTGGTDGVPTDPDIQDAILIGNSAASSGMKALSDPEQVDIDLVACPGHSSTLVVEALLDLCQNDRRDCLAIIDPPFGLTVNEIVGWQNGAHTLNTDKFDSDFGALYWPWLKFHDSTNGIDVWVPPSVGVLAAIARSDSISAPWFAPAGLARGVVPNILDVYTRPTLAERDSMQGFRNCVNPIIGFNGVDGFLIFGQKTLQRRPTALDRVNVRRLLFYLEKQIRAASRSLLFDPHDSLLESQFVFLARGILDPVKIQRGLNDYFVKCDAELNPPDVVDRNELRAQIGVQPLRAAEFIFIEFSIHRTGSFTENALTF